MKQKFHRLLTAVVEKDLETGYLFGFIPGIPGAHTQADTLDELNKNLTEVTSLCIEELKPSELKSLPVFIGTQQIEISK